jgi:hypothetical protein
MFRAFAVTLLIAFPLSAQYYESLAGLRFRFDAPGARSSGMGGTTEALTDVFAAATNPAALAEQRTRSAAVEFRRSVSSTDFITGGELLARHELTPVTSENAALSSAIVVLPAARTTWAVYYDEPLSASMAPSALPRGTPLSVGIDPVGRIVPASECTGTCTVTHFVGPIASRIDTALTVRRLGVAGAHRIGQVSLGASIRHEQLNESAFSTLRAEKLTWSAGAQWQLTPALRAAGSYRSGAGFPAGDGYFFRTPSSFAAGLAADVRPNITLAMDAVRVRYHEMEAGMVDDSYDLPDVTELHAGAEWRLATRVPVALRAGWWRDPAHRMQSNLGPINGDLRNLALLDADENHITAGVGIGTRVRLDAAYDRSENTSRASLTLATAF